MKKLITTLFFLSGISVASFAGSHGPNAVTVANSSNYDVVYYRISFTINPASSAAISNGSVTTYFKTTAANVGSLQFDMNGSLTASTVMYHGSSITKAAASNVLTITLPANIATKGTLDSVTINYSGTPAKPPGTTSVPSGYNYVANPAGIKTIYTLSEPFTAPYWRPCKETLADKIDSVDLIVTCPNNYKIAGNGTVTETASGSNTITRWKTRYPIANYLINFAAANYQNYQYTITTSAVSLPVMNYFYAGDNTSAFQTKADEIKKILPVFVNLFGPYPFLNEKYGLAECTQGWGALEVQSMTFMASDSYDKYTVAHEMGHQWFGDKLTTNSWHQIWLNEGFAQYIQSVIFPENVYPGEAATQQANLKSAVSVSNTTTYVTDTTTADKIFVGAASQPYQKGAMILSMLRSWLGDTKFFAALKSYVTSPGLSYNFTSVDSLQSYMEATTPGLNLTTFFNGWVKNPGRVTYAVKYQTVTNGIYLQLVQSPTVSGTAHFDMPIPIEIKNTVTGLDTIVTILDQGGKLYDNVNYHTYNSNVIFYHLSSTPNTAPGIDPKNRVLATGTVTTSATLSTLITLPFQEIKLTPVPAGNEVNLNWSITTDERMQSVIIEKSADGINFTSLKTFNPAFTSANLYQGTATDELAYAGTYYRIRIVKEDGAFVYSSIQYVKGRKAQAFQLAPNPASDQMVLSIPENFNNGSLKLTITNMTGQTVKEMTLGAGNAPSVSVRDLSEGVYNAKITNGAGEFQAAQFLKK